MDSRRLTKTQLGGGVLIPFHPAEAEGIEPTHRLDAGAPVLKSPPKCLWSRMASA